MSPSAIGPYSYGVRCLSAAAAYNGGSLAGDYSTFYSYDANSNLTGITRRAIEGFPGDNAFMPGGTIYALDGNQVTVRLQGGSGAFRPLMNNAVVTDFRQVYYDACGRMVRDNDKGISKIAYNELHLPYSIEHVGESTAPISYGVQYAADGRKLRTGVLRTAAQGIPVNGIGGELSREPLIVFETATDYVGNLVYKNGILEKVLVDGGFITAADMRYHFFVTDHLGNVRVVVNDAGVVEQVNQFYPYGEATDMGQALPASVDNPYKWGGKEWDEDQGAYDFGARMYSAADARWTTMDPLSEKYYHLSPYAYCAGNPVNLVDPDGSMLAIMYTVDGEQRYFYYTGVETNIPDNDYVRSVIEAYKYDKENWIKAGNSNNSPAANLVESQDKMVYVYKEYGYDTQYYRGNGGIPYLRWNPEEGLKTENNKVLSPATIFAHEADHAFDDLTDAKIHSDRKDQLDDKYTNMEEERVINGSEQLSACANGEIKRGEVTRTNHRGKTVITCGPTSNVIDQGATRYYYKHTYRSHKW